MNKNDIEILNFVQHELPNEFKVENEDNIYHYDLHAIQIAIIFYSKHPDFQGDLNKVSKKSFDYLLFKDCVSEKKESMEKVKKHFNLFDKLFQYTYRKLSTRIN